MNHDNNALAQASTFERAIKDPLGLSLDLYEKSEAQLAALSGEVADRISRAGERLGYLDSKQSASELAIREHQDQLGTLLKDRSRDDAEAQHLRDSIFEWEMYGKHVNAAHTRAVASRE